MSFYGFAEGFFSTLRDTYAQEAQAKQQEELEIRAENRRQQFLMAMEKMRARTDEQSQLTRAAIEMGIDPSSSKPEELRGLLARSVRKGRARDEAKEQAQYERQTEMQERERTDRRNETASRDIRSLRQEAARIGVQGVGQMNEQQLLDAIAERSSAVGSAGSVASPSDNDADIAIARNLLGGAYQGLSASDFLAVTNMAREIVRASQNRASSGSLLDVPPAPITFNDAIRQAASAMFGQPSTSGSAGGTVSGDRVGFYLG